MKKLETALPTMQNTVQQQESTTGMPSGGLRTQSGETITQSASHIAVIGHSEPGTRPLTTSSQSMQTRKDRVLLLRDLVQQSFDIFNVYGKQPEAITNIIKGFDVVLGGYDPEDIRAGFLAWIETQSAMPTPAEIKKLADRNRIIRKKMGQPTVWKKRLADKIGLAAVLAWFSGAIVDDGEIVAGSKFQAEWIRDNYIGEVEELGFTLKEH